MPAEPNRREFAAVTAEAYTRQYHPLPRFRSAVMNDMVVIYDHDENWFGCQSSLIPLLDEETVVLTIEEGMFGDPGTREVRRQIERYALECSDLWWDVLDRIRQDAAERAGRKVAEE